jgi:hypothetical protein
MKEHVDIVMFRKDAFGGCGAIDSYSDVPERVRWTIGLTHKRAGFSGSIEMEYARTMESDPEFWEVKTVAGKQAAA